MAFSSELGLAQLGALELGFIGGVSPPSPPAVVDTGGSAGGLYPFPDWRKASHQRLLMDDDELMLILSSWRMQ